MVGMDELTDCLTRQAGVVSRRQVRAAGHGDAYIARMIRRRHWARVHPGVYVDHTGPLTWLQQAWAAVLYAHPAALAGRSALHAHRVRGHDNNEIHVAVPHTRKVRPRPGVRIERLTEFDAAVQANLSPPRVRVEHALLRVASSAPTDDAAVGVLADGCQSRRTTAARLAHELRTTPSLPRRGLLLAIVDDVASGALSVLERRYLRQVELAHGLPRGQRQHADTSGQRAAHRDVEYVEQRLVLELDGRLGHEWAVDRWSDLDRDLTAATTGSLTLRAGWGQVMQPCRLARLMALVLKARGWTGSPVPCATDCTIPAHSPDGPASSSTLNPASSRTGTPRPSALSALEPGLSPTTT